MFSYVLIQIVQRSSVPERLQADQKITLCLWFNLTPFNDLSGINHIHHLKKKFWFVQWTLSGILKNCFFTSEAFITYFLKKKLFLIDNINYAVNTWFFDTYPNIVPLLRSKKVAGKQFSYQVYRVMSIFSTKGAFGHQNTL